MRILRAIGTGAVVWALIFVLWSILVFAPVVKDYESVQWVFHFLLLVPIVIFGASVYYRGKDKTNGLLVGLVMLVTAIVLDAVISVPFFIQPQGIGYAEFFLNPLMLVGFLEFLLIMWLYWNKKIKSQSGAPAAPSAPQAPPSPPEPPSAPPAPPTPSSPPQEPGA